MSFETHVALCAIWYQLYNLRNTKNTHGGVLLLLLKVTMHHGYFSRFLNCTNSTKSRKASHICLNWGLKFHFSLSSPKSDLLSPPIPKRSQLKAFSVLISVSLIFRTCAVFWIFWKRYRQFRLLHTITLAIKFGGHKYSLF